MKQTFTAIGLMSGTSLDGLDIAYCAFTQEGGNYRYRLLAAETTSYDDSWRARLTFRPDLSGYELKALDIAYGTWLGEKVADFIMRHNATPDFVASHGHTWFHDPANRLNLQLGDGYEMHRLIGRTVVNDFRSLDIRMGGQGAPLVPIGDHLLFKEYDCCINLGGIANISGMKAGQRLSFDIAPFNLVLNKLAAREGLAYDAGGKLAASGKLLTPLSDELAQLGFFQQPPPKSLGIEWVSEVVYPLFDQHSDLLSKDLLHTYSSFAANEVSRSIRFFDQHRRVLVTGGGAKNDFFISQLRQQLGASATIEVPDDQLVDYKEAIVFAFLGLLRITNQVNCLKEVTGASQSVSGGVVYDQLS